MQMERLEIQNLVIFCILHERKARLQLGNQLTLLMGKELEPTPNWATCAWMS